MFGVERLEPILGRLALFSTVLEDPLFRASHSDEEEYKRSVGVLRAVVQWRRVTDCAVRLIDKLRGYSDHDDQSFKDSQRAEVAAISRDPVGRYLLGLVGGVYWTFAREQLKTGESRKARELFHVLGSAGFAVHPRLKQLCEDTSADVTSTTLEVCRKIVEDRSLPAAQRSERDKKRINGLRALGELYLSL